MCLLTMEIRGELMHDAVSSGHSTHCRRKGNSDVICMQYSAMTDVIGIDHIYITVRELARSEAFYDQLFLAILGFRKNQFTLCNTPHIQYYNRHMGYVLRPTQMQSVHNPDSPGLHHLCFRVDTVAEVVEVATQLRNAGIAASAAAHYPDYAADYWATYFKDPDGIQLEVTNYRMERRDRHDNWYPNIGE